MTKLQLGPRDKLLLAILAIVILGALFFWFVFNPITTHIDEQRARELELEIDLADAQAEQVILAGTVQQQGVVLEEINEIIGSYYPYIPPQYFAYLLQYFAMELELGIFLMEVNSPSYQDLTGIPTADFRPRDDLLASIARFNELAGTGEDDATETETYNDTDTEGEEPSEPDEAVVPDADEDAEPIEPGMVILTRLTVEVRDGNVGQYLAFLRSINEAAHPIYVSEYRISLNSDQELEMRVSISVIAFDRLSVAQWEEDRSRFTFDPQRPREEINIFAVSGIIRGIIGDLEGIDVEEEDVVEEDVVDDEALEDGVNPEADT